MVYVERKIVCAVCGGDFVWSAADQAAAAESRVPARTTCLPCLRAPGVAAGPRRPPVAAALPPRRNQSRRKKPAVAKPARRFRARADLLQMWRRVRLAHATP